MRQARFLKIGMLVAAGIVLSCSAQAEVTARHNMFENFTSVSTHPNPRVQNQVGSGVLRVGASYVCDGDTTACGLPALLSLVFTSESSPAKGWIYDYRPNLMLRVDGERMDLGKGAREGKVIGGSPFEVIQFNVTPAQWAKLIKAKVVEGQLGPTEFRFGSDILAGFAEIEAAFTGKTRAIRYRD